MRLLPERISVRTSELMALLELAKYGSRSQADHLLVAGIEKDLDQMSAAQALRLQASAPMADGEMVKNATNNSGPISGAEGAQPTGAGDGDSGSKGAESHGASAGVE